MSGDPGAQWIPKLPWGIGAVLYQKSVTYDASNTTESEVVATLTGSVEPLAIWGQVTTAIGSNHTAAHLRLNDQTNTVDVTLASGTTLSSAAAGSVVAVLGTEADALTLLNNSQVRQSLDVFIPRIWTKKTGATTTLDHRYTTTQTPTTGVILWNIVYVPRSSDGALA